MFLFLLFYPQATGEWAGAAGGTGGERDGVVHPGAATEAPGGPDAAGDMAHQRYGARRHGVCDDGEVGELRE